MSTAETQSKSRIPTISQKNSFLTAENSVNGSYSSPVPSQVSAEEAFSPRIKKSPQKTKYIIDEEFPSASKKGNFGDFINKIELFQKAKNDKLICLQAIKKQREDEELKSIPKVRMSENSKKILEEKRKKTQNNDPQPQVAGFSSLTKVQSQKCFSYSSKMLKNKEKNLNPVILETKVKTKEAPSQVRSEKVLASKFIKEFTKSFEEVSQGRQSLQEQETQKLLKTLYFLSEDSENLVKKEIEEKLFIKMWKITGSEETGFISFDSLKTFALGVMNFFLPSMSHNQPGVQLGRVVLGRFHLSPEEVLKIHKLFFPFYENRVNHVKKIAQTTRFEKFIKMQEVFKAQKTKENLSQNFKTFNSVKPRSEKITQKTLKNLSPAKSWAKLSQRSTCNTPAQDKLNTSFRSARSRSRSKSRAKDSRLSSVSEVEWVGVNHDQIADPSIIARAQDVLGIFNLKKKDEKIIESESKANELIADKAEKNEKVMKSESKKNDLIESQEKHLNDLQKSKSQNLLFNRREVPSKGTTSLIDEGLKKVQELLKERVQNDDTVIDVNMPDGTLKTLQMPKGSNQRLMIQKFIKENKLSQEMGKTLLNSINNP